MWNDLEYRDGMLFWNPYTPPTKSHADAGRVAGRNRNGRRAGTLKRESGYRRVRVGGGKIMYEHRIVWEMHNGAIPEGMQVDHINGIRDDNRIENLQLLTLVENGVRRTVKYGESPYCDGPRKVI